MWGDLRGLHATSPAGIPLVGRHANVNIAIWLTTGYSKLCTAKHACSMFHATYRESNNCADFMLQHIRITQAHENRFSDQALIKGTPTALVLGPSCASGAPQETRFLVKHHTTRGFSTRTRNVVTELVYLTLS